MNNDSVLTNWAGNYTYSTKNLTSPTSLDELKSFIKTTEKFKVIGSRHCFNSIADSDNHLLSLDSLEQKMEIDAETNTVTVGGAVRYGQLAEYLYQNGYAIHNLASLPHISIAGACATATHGSGSKNGNLSTAVTAMELITADGEELYLSLEKDRETFLGAVVNLGALGVITKMTLKIQPAFMVKQNLYENLPFAELEHHFEEIMGSGYSVSLFTDYTSPMFREVWLKNVVTENANTELPAEFFTATAATENLHPIAGISPENCTEQLGVPGPSHERLPHFKMGFTPSSGVELQSEFFVPRQHSYDAICAIARLSEQLSPLLFISEIRTIDADDFWMSPCYKQPSTGIHFTWKQDWEAVQKVLPLIEKELEPYNARPHWGKLFTMPLEKIEKFYEKLPDFRQLIQQYDSKGKFRNQFISKNIFGS